MSLLARSWAINCCWYRHREAGRQIARQANKQWRSLRFLIQWILTPMACISEPNVAMRQVLGRGGWVVGQAIADSFQFNTDQIGPNRKVRKHTENNWPIGTWLNAPSETALEFGAEYCLGGGGLVTHGGNRFYQCYLTSQWLKNPTDIIPCRVL